MRHACILASFLFAVTAAAVNYDIERPISPLRGGATSPYQESLQVATDGETFLAIWKDARSGSPANVGETSVPYLPHVGMAQRVDAQGRIIATIELPFLVGDGLYFDAQAVWTGRNYIVAFNGEYVRISREGALLDAAPRKLPVSYLAALTARGSQIIGVSRENPNYPAKSSALLVTIFDDELQPLRTMRIDDAASVYRNVGVAASRDGFAVFYIVDFNNGTPAHIQAVLYDRDGNVVRDRFAALQLTCADYLKAASDGTNYFVATNVCTSDHSLLTWHFAGAAFTPKGTPLAASNDLATHHLTETYTDLYSWGLTPTPSGYAIATLELNGNQPALGIIPIDTYGAAAAPVRAASGGLWANRLALGANAKGEMLLLWSNVVYNTRQVLARGETFAGLSDFAAGRVATFRLADGPFTQEAISAAVASDGTALVTWRERTGPAGPLALYAARIAPDGTILDPDSIRLTDATVDATRAAVVSDGRDFLVAWSEDNAIGFRRVGSDGHAFPTAYVVAIGKMSSPALAWNGSGYLLAWNNSVPDMVATTWTTQVVPISAAGAAVGFPQAINAPVRSSATGVSTTYVGTPLVASDGKDFLVAFTQLTTNTYTYASAVSRVNAAGTVTTGNVPIVLPAPSVLFWNGTNYVALSATLDGIYGVRINANALPLDGTPGGGPASSGPPLPGHWTAFGMQPQCDANGCYAAELLMTKDKTLQLSTWRITDANGAFDRSTPTVAATIPAMFAGNSTAIVLPGKAPRLVYSRNAIEPQYLGVNRVFIRTEAPQKARAVRH